MSQHGMISTVYEGGRCMNVQACSCGVGEVVKDPGSTRGGSWPAGTPSWTYRCTGCGATRGPFVHGD